MDQSGAVVIAAREVKADHSGAVVVLASRVEGEVKTLFGPRESILLGIAAGAAAGLILLLGRRLGER